jgi:hypothetical protein
VLLQRAVTGVRDRSGRQSDQPNHERGASGKCDGSLIESRNLNVGGKKVGELDVYYNSATGKNCARMNHAGSTWGQKLTTRVWIGICSETKPGNGTCHYDAATDAVDKGSYAYYADRRRPRRRRPAAASRRAATCGSAASDTPSAPARGSATAAERPREHRVTHGACREAAPVLSYGAGVT